MYNLVGFTSISLLFLITLMISLRWPAISKIIFTALVLRFLFLLINNHFINLPDGDMDAKNYEQFAWEFSQNGIFNKLKDYRPGAYFISHLISIPYYLFGRSILLAQSLSILFGIGCVLLGWLLAKKIWDNHTATKVGWVIALFPTLVSYSVLTMREVYVSFFLLIAIYGIVNWVRENNLKSIFQIIFGFVGATFFHGALIIGLFVFLFIIFLQSLKKTLELFRDKRSLNIKTSILIIFSSTILILYFTNKISLPYIHTFDESIDTNFLKESVINTKVKGAASYPEWTKIKENSEFFYKIPIRSIYFLFSPFPWEVKKLTHLIGAFDSFIYIFLSYLIFRNRIAIWRDPALRIILIILFFYFIIFGLGVGNFGSSIRHRSKFIIELVLLAAPLIPKFVFYKRKQIKETT